MKDLTFKSPFNYKKNSIFFNNKRNLEFTKNSLINNS